MQCSLAPGSPGYRRRRMRRIDAADGILCLLALSCVAGLGRGHEATGRGRTGLCGDHRVGSGCRPSARRGAMAASGGT
eukprot:scaffold44827_cov258-Isochrysis_galbana.AAC.1